MVDLSTLNENQLKAVNWNNGPLLVLAGPGSGKTRVLTFRIARILEDTSNKYFKILGLTFTNKAAAEMRERITSLVPDAGSRTLLTTFHSFAADLLRQHGHHNGLRPDFTVLAQDTDRHSLLDDAIERAGAQSAGQTSENLLPLISALIENDVAPDKSLDVLEKASSKEPQVLACIYQHYRNLMIERNALDFVGLIAEALNLLRSRPGVCKQIQRVYPYICVDEFQDTNLSQFKILHHLVNSETQNLFVVADDDQIIYQWNGANPERLWELQKDFNMKMLQLPQNYRCPAPVVEFANNLIVHNFGRSEEKVALTAYKGVSDPSVVRLQRFEQFSTEADWVAKDIARRSPQDQAGCVILARTKRLLEQIVDALDAHGISGYLAVRKNEFETPPLQWLHSILRLANSRGSRENLRKVCKAFYAVEGIHLDVRDVISFASTEGGDYLRGWSLKVLERSELSKEARQFIEASLVPDLLDRLDFWSLQNTVFSSWLDNLPDAVPDAEGVFVEYEEEKNTWQRLVNEISVQYGDREVSLHTLLQELDLRSKSPVPPQSAVPCFTIHASKGMEFNHVYLIGMVEDQLPSWAAIKRGDNSHEIQEERRNCFVAITRARETLTLTYSDRLQGWEKRPSRFLFEMGLL